MSGIPAWAVPGAKVVCVDDSPPTSDKAHFHQKWLQAGNIYVIRAAYVGADGEVGVCLGEIVSVFRPELGREQGFYLRRFRPAVEPKSEAEDVALFKHHLDQKLPVDA